ncbi:uncharacterized protein LOC142776432 isoform X1 [Rhipicephalus microplus]|uniref:uncharacterized protein LOC142776432 isoform X1 n=1 Tax=Rhipicephalus microplus TaxID=6941 RepID=UPI003F6C1243
MVKKTVKCSECGVGRKVEISAEEKAEDDAKCRQCEFEEKMKNMMAVQSGLMEKIAALENALAKEREKTSAMEERLRAAEKGLSKAVKGNEDAGDGGSIMATNPRAGEMKETGMTKADTLATGPSYREVVLREGGSKPAAVTHASHLVSSQVQVSEGMSEEVIIAGDSNLVRCAAAIKERVKGDKRVAIGTFPGQTLGTVMSQAGEHFAAKAVNRNLVVIAGGLNDVLKKESSGLATALARGVDDMRTVSPQVQIVVCTVPEVPVRNVNLRRAVVDANKEIWRISREKGFEVVDLNREVHRWGGFQRDRIHFDKRLGHEVGWRLAGRTVAFLGGSRALRSPG